MRCYNCGGFLYEGNVCNVCGADVSLYRKIIHKSNELYNQALEYANVRNLAGAARCLEISLRFYKLNINSRNLLGLVYYELGDYAKAFAQWVLSKNIQPDNNLANEFLEKFQKSKSEMGKINHAVSKYNKAVCYIQQGSFDLAEIQLKKLLNDHNNMVKGHQLLALLLTRKNKLAEARVALKKAEKIDAGNPVTISYLASVREDIKEEEKDLSPMEIKAKRKEEQPEEDRAPLSGDDVIIPKSTYKEHNPMVMAIIQIVIGIIVGAAIVFFIVTPAKTKASKTELTQVKTDYENQIASLNSKLAGFEKEKAAKPETTDGTALQASEQFNILFDVCTTYFSGDIVGAAQKLSAIANPDAVENESFKNLYNTAKAVIYPQASDVLWNQGEAFWNIQDFENAAICYALGYEYDNADEDALFYAGKGYDNAGDAENARKYYNLYLEKFPEGQHSYDANTRLAEMG